MPHSKCEGADGRVLRTPALHVEISRYRLIVIQAAAAALLHAIIVDSGPLLAHGGVLPVNDDRGPRDALADPELQVSAACTRKCSSSPKPVILLLTDSRTLKGGLVCSKCTANCSVCPESLGTRLASSCAFFMRKASSQELIRPMDERFPPWPSISGALGDWSGRFLHGEMWLGPPQDRCWFMQWLLPFIRKTNHNHARSLSMYSGKCSIGGRAHFACNMRREPLKGAPNPSNF